MPEVLAESRGSESLSTCKRCRLGLEFQRIFRGSFLHICATRKQSNCQRLNLELKTKPGSVRPGQVQPINPYWERLMKQWNTHLAGVAKALSAAAVLGFAA